MKKITLILTAAMLWGSAIAQTTWYVKTDGNDSNSGTSWADAFQTLDRALDTVQEGDEIRIAAGTYYPTKDASEARSNPLNINPMDCFTPFVMTR